MWNLIKEWERKTRGHYDILASIITTSQTLTSSLFYTQKEIAFLKSASLSWKGVKLRSMQTISNSAMIRSAYIVYYLAHISTIGGGISDISVTCFQQT
jgi:hypothetical protein